MRIDSEKLRGLQSCGITTESCWIIAESRGIAAESRYTKSKTKKLTISNKEAASVIIQHLWFPMKLSRIFEPFSHLSLTIFFTWYGR